MPCLTIYPDDHEIERENTRNRNHARVEAALCAILTHLKTQEQLTNVLRNVNWEEAGVTRKQVVSWWDAHLAKDARRRQTEMTERENREKAQRLAKKPWQDLTASQRKHLITWSK